MPSTRTRQAFRDEEKDEGPLQQGGTQRLHRRMPDNSGDESPAHQAAPPRRLLTGGTGRLKHAGVVRPEESGDLRPTTPPAGPSSRGSRQADLASAVLQMLQQSALATAFPFQGADAMQRSRSGSVSSKTSGRPRPAAGGSSKHRPTMGPQPSSSTKIAAARTFDNSSSDEDESGWAIAPRQPAASAEVKPQSSLNDGGVRTRSTLLHVSSGLGTTSNVDSLGAGSGGFAVTAAAAFEGLNNDGPNSTYRRQQRTSRLRRVSGNESLVSESSHQESLVSSRQTLGSSKLSATVQRVVARQRLMDSSSGEEDNDELQGVQQVDSDVGQAARVLARLKSISSSTSASGIPPTTAAPPLPCGVLGSGQKSPTALVYMTKGKSACKDASVEAAAVRPMSAAGSSRVRLGQTEHQRGEPGVFSFSNAAKGCSSVVSDGISPRMHQAAAAATAEVSAVAASSLRPLPLTTIAPARLTSPERSSMSIQQSTQEPCCVGGAATSTPATRHLQGSSQSVHVSSSQRIATWLEQQPSLCSAVVADDIASEYATTLTGTEIELDHAAAGAKASGRAVGMATLESIISGDEELLGSGPGSASYVKKGPSRSRAVRLTISSDEDDVPDNRDIALVATDRGRSKKNVSSEVEKAPNNQPARLSSGAAKSTHAASANPAARRLEFAGQTTSVAATPHMLKERMSSYSSPSVQPSEARGPDDPPPSSPSDGLETAVLNSDKASRAAVCGKERPDFASRLRSSEIYGVEGQQARGASSSKSSVRALSDGSGKRSKASSLAAAGRLTPNELRVMLSVLSRPPWAGNPAPSTLTPQPSRSTESVRSFSYSEMLQVVRAMSSGGSGNQRDSGTQDGSRFGCSHKSGKKGAALGAATTPFAGLQRLPSSQMHHHHEHQRSARPPITAHTSLEMKTSHATQSVDGTSYNGSMLGEHPMAAPQERDWSASASTISGRSYSYDQHHHNFTDIVQLLSMLTGRHLTPDAVQSMGMRLNPDGTGTLRSSGRGSASIRSGGSGSITHQSAAAFAASAAAMATSAVMAVAGTGHHLNTYLQAGNLHPFLDPVTAATAATQAPKDTQLGKQQRSLSPAAASGAKARPLSSEANLSLTRSPGSTSRSTSSPAQARPTESHLHHGQHHDGDTPASIQADLRHLLYLVNAAGQTDVPSDVSDAAKSNLGRLVQMFGSGAGTSENLAVRKMPIAADGDVTAADTPPMPSSAPDPTAAAVCTSALVERIHARKPSSRRSSADTVETGEALGRLYQSLRNLRVRDESDQTEGGEQMTSHTSSVGAQTSSSNLQKLHMADESTAPGVALQDMYADAGVSLHTMLPRNSSSHSKTKEDAATIAVHHSTSRGQLHSPATLQTAVPTTPALPASVANSFAGQGIRLTSAIKLPNGQLMELDSVLALASDEAAFREALGDVDPTVRQSLQDLCALNTASTNPIWCTSPSTTDGGVQTDLTVLDLAAVFPSSPSPPSQQPLQGVGTGCRTAAVGTILSEASDSAAALGTSITAAPAIKSAAPFGALCSSTSKFSVEGVAAFPMRNLPIASEGGIMAAPNQEAVTAGRVGSAGGMLAYLEAADPTTATALLELVQALQLMTLHARRRRWISDGSSTASGVYLVDPQLEDGSMGGSSGGATTLRYSFGTSIGPSVSQGGHAAFVDMPDTDGLLPGALAVKAATTGGLEEDAALGTPQPKRQTHNGGPAPRILSPGAETTARHLRRALRAVSGGGTVRLTPTGLCEVLNCSIDVGAGARAVDNARSSVSLGAVTEAAKLHISRALELLSRAPDIPTGVSVGATDADVELRAQEELVAALMALLAPVGNVTFQTAKGDIHLKQQQHEILLSASPDQVVQATQETSLTPSQQRADTTRILASNETSPVKLAIQPDALTPASPLHARIQEVLQQAERASASISSLQVGLSPTAPAAAEVLEGVPFEQAIGYIMDGLRDFDGGPSNLARHLHLMYSPSRGSCVFYPTALDSLASRRETAVALGAAAMLEAVAGSVTSSGAVLTAVSSVSSEEPQPLTDAERERMQALISEAVAAAEALARGASREEAWTAERLGLHLEADTLADEQHTQERERISEDTKAMQARSDLAEHSSPLSTLAVQKSGVESTSAPQQQQQLLSNSSATAAILPRQHVADLGGAARTGLIYDGDLSTRPSASSIQRSAPVTIAGVLPMDEADSQIGLTYAAQTSSPQTFGGAMELPEDRALEQKAPHSTPYLPCGGLDDDLQPIQQGGESILQASGLPLETLPITDASAVPGVTRLPTFATPSTPAVRGMATCPQSVAIGDSVAPVEVTPEGPFAGAHGGTTDSKQMSTKGPAYGWESVMAGGARICSAEVTDVVAALQPSVLSTRQQLETIITGGASMPPAVSISHAPTPELLSHPAETDAMASTSTGDPKLPALTARDRFASPRPSEALPSCVAESPVQVPLKNTSVSPSVTGAMAQTSSEASSGVRVEVLQPQSSSLSLDSNGDAKGSLPSMRLARDTLSGWYTSQLAVDRPVPEEQSSTALSRGAIQGVGDDIRQDRGETEAAELVDGHARRALFASAPVQLEHARDEETTATTNPQTKQLLTKAAQLLFQAMQRAAEGQPEQEAAFCALAPILQGLAAVEGSQVSELDSARSLPVQHKEEAEVEATELGSACKDTSARAEMPSTLHKRGSMPQPIEATILLDANSPRQNHLATTADLESFKDDVMASVRSALVEIVDMIGATVAQSAAAATIAGPLSEDNGRDVSIPSIGCEAEGGWDSSRADLSSVMQLDLSLPLAPERSVSPSLGMEHREIRITREELEAFMFGKAVLSRSTTDDLLGVGLRQLYAPQLSQGKNNERTAGDDAANGGPGDARVIHDHFSGNVLATGDNDVDKHQRPPRPCSYEVMLHPPALGTQGELPAMFGEASELGEQYNASKLEQATGSSTTVPRDSPLRKPMGNGLKSLFRRSIEHLRDHLQSARVMGAQHSLSTAEGFPVSPVPLAPITRQNPYLGTATSEASTGRALPQMNTLEATLSSAGMPPLPVRQMATVAAAETTPDPATTAAPVHVSSVNDDDVELEPYLSGGLQPEATTDLARFPDPAAPAAQRSTRLQSQTQSQVQSQSRCGTVDSTPEVETIGDFLAAIAEPMMQVVGVLNQPGGSVGSRVYPRRSIVIEELTDDQLPSQQQLQQRPERPSRVPGFVATNSGSHVVLAMEDDENFGRIPAVTGGASSCIGSGRAQMSSPRAASEADLSRIHHAALERAATALPHFTQARELLLCPRSASTTPVPRSTTLQTSGSVGLIEHPPTATARPAQTSQQSQCLHTHTQVSPIGASRLKMPSVQGADPIAAEDRPLSSFVSPSEGGAEPSPPRRRTHSPGPLRCAALRQEPSGTATASVLAIQTSRSVNVVASPPGTSLDELESFLRAFRTRIGTDETGNEPIVMPRASEGVVPTDTFYPQSQHMAMEQAIQPRPSLAMVTTETTSPLLRHPFRHQTVPEAAGGPISEVEDVRRSTNLSESVSINSTRRVITGFNMFTIRASGASALAAAAAVEEAFSPRTERELGLAAAAAAAAGSRMGFPEPGVAPQQLLPRSMLEHEVPEVPVRCSIDNTGSGRLGPTDASRGSSSATPTKNPVLREHLEHFQALLEKANDLVDRLMLADEDLASEGGAAEVTATPSPRNATPSSGNKTRRQLTYRLTHQRSGSVAVTPQRQPSEPTLSALTPNTPTDVNFDNVVATPTLPAATLDPELAALFPATAARLARPYANIEQSSDAANSLLSSAVTAVPQLAKGADYIRSKGSSPLSRSPGASLGDIPAMNSQPAHRASVPTVPTPSQSVGFATPLALVASLLAEAHSRMEFQSLEEQRGADRILSAVLDEHFAHVLGTPRGFLTPPRLSTVRVDANGAATAAVNSAQAMTPAPTPMQSLPQTRPNAVKQAPLSGVFSRAFTTAAEAKGTEVSHGRAESQGMLSQEGKLLDPENSSTLGLGASQAASQGLERTSAEGMLQQKLHQPSSQERHEEMNIFLAKVMQQRSDILTSALDHVHRVGIPAVMVQLPEMLSEGTDLPSMSSAVHATAQVNGTSRTNLDASLPSSAIPGASGGQPLMPQPLMPYQEIDSESTPTSYNVSMAGSAFHPESSANWSHGPSPRTMNVLPVDSTSLHMAGRVSSVVAAGAEMPAASPVVAGANVRRVTYDNIIAPIPSNATSTAPEPAATAEARGGYDLSHLMDDDDGTLSAGHSSVSQRSGPASAPHLRLAYDAISFNSNRGSGGMSTLKGTSSLDGSHSHISAVPEPPREAALRYNPVYDPAVLPLGDCLTGTAFGAAAAAAAVGETGINATEVGSGGMTTLHHETNYTPLAIAAADFSDGGASGIETSLHSRLRSAGGTSTAVLVPNPMYDFPTESPAMVLGTAANVSGAVAVLTAVAATVSHGAMPIGDDNTVGNVDATTPGHCSHPQLNFPEQSSSDGSMSSGRDAGAMLPHLLVHGMDSHKVANIAALQRPTCASKSDVGMSDPNVTSESGAFPAADAPGSGYTSAELSSLFANSLTESQLNLLAVAPELPNSRRQSHSLPQHLSAAQWLMLQQQQQLLSAGDAHPVSAAVVKPAPIMLVGGLTDVAISLDFEEISREAAAVADTLSAHTSVEMVDPLAGMTGIVPCAARQGTNHMAAPTTPTVPSALSADSAAAAAEQLHRPLSGASTPGYKRHMGDAVAAAVRRFELGMASSPLEGAGQAVTATTSASTTAAAHPAKQPALDSVKSIISSSLSSGPSADWQSVALPMTCSAEALSRQATGARFEVVPSVATGGPPSIASQGSLIALGPGTLPDLDRMGASTVHTREWVVPPGCHEIVTVTMGKEIEEQKVCVGSDSTSTEELEQGSLQDQAEGRLSEVGMEAKLAKVTERGGASSAFARQSGSPAHPARHSGSPSRPAWRSGTTAGGSGLGSGGIGAVGRASKTPSGSASRSQQARALGGAAALVTARASTRQPSPGHVRSPANGPGTSSPSSVRVSALQASANSSNSSNMARRATQSPLRTTQVSCINRASMPGGRVTTGGTPAAVAAQLQAGQAGLEVESGGREKPLNETARGNRTGRRT